MRTSFTLSRDGTSLAFRSVGQGPALILTNGLATSHFYWSRVSPYWQARARVVTWDLRGHGESEPSASKQEITVADSVDDLRRVMDAAGIGKAVLAGFSFGCQIVLEAVRHMPDRILAIVPILGTYRRPFDTLVHPKVGPQILRLLRGTPDSVAQVGLRLAGWTGRLPGAFSMSRRLGIVGPLVSEEDMRPFFEHIGRLDARTWKAMGSGAAEHSAEALLERIDAPVLVVAGGKDVYTPPGAAEEMARRIPGADLFFLPKASHTGLLEFPREIALRVEAFLERHGIL